MPKIKYFFQQSWLLISASFFFGLLIAVTNAALSPRIEQNKINKRNRLVVNLLPQARDFVSFEIEIETNPARGQKEIVEVFRAMSEAGERVGWSFNAIGSGFADKIELVVAVDENFETLAGFDVLTSNETPGFGDQIKLSYYRNQFVGAPTTVLELVKIGNAEEIDSEIVAISGATVSSQAVVDIINQYLQGIKNQIQEEGLIDNVE